MRVRGGQLAASEQSSFVGGECRFEVVGGCCDRLAEFGAVEHRTQHDPKEYPFAHQVATQLREHDDREQFLTGVDLILVGIAAAR